MRRPRWRRTTPAAPKSGSQRPATCRRIYRRSRTRSPTAIRRTATMVLPETWPDYFRSPSLFAAHLLGIVPHETQSAFLECGAQTKVAACGRRWGKSTAAAIDLIHLAVVGIDGQPTKQMVVAPTGDQYTIICDEVESLLLNSPLASQVERIVHSPFFEVRLTWGSRILGRSAGETGRNLRGRGVHRVVIDEAAFIPEEVIQTAIIPMLADYNGQLILISSPFGRNVFWEYFVRGDGGGDPHSQSFHFPSHLNPHISRAYIEAQRETMTDLQFRAEWLAEFLDDQSTVFKWALIERAQRGELEPPREGHRYAVGWDPAKYHDRSAVVVIDTTEPEWRVTAVDAIEGRDYTLQVQRVCDLASAYNAAPLRMDCTGNAALLEQVRQRHRKSDGLTFTNAAKQEIIDGVV